MIFGRILVGWDGSRDSEHAVRVSTSLATELGADVLVLAVLQRPETVECMDELESEMTARKLRTQAALNRLTSASCVHSEIVEASDPVAALHGYAQEHGFDLLVLGRHGVDRALHPQIGTVVEQEVRHSSCPVLVVGHDELVG